jgi:hypothetical protein
LGRKRSIFSSFLSPKFRRKENFLKFSYVCFIGSKDEHTAQTLFISAKGLWSKLTPLCSSQLLTRRKFSWSLLGQGLVNE